MNTELIPIIKGQWLDKALESYNSTYKTIPTDVILNKVLTGLGATYMEIKAKRHSIIIEPNVPVILGKVEQHKDALAIRKGCTKNQIKKYLNNNKIKYKKLLSTPEGYKKIRDVINDGFQYIYNDYFMLFDECEKITQDHDYRPNISIPLNDFFHNFKNRAFVSATPLTPSDPRFVDQNFRILKIVPQFNYKKDLDLIATNDFETELLNYFKKYKKSDCICIFLNKTDNINRIINTLGIAKESKVFCSKESKEKLKKLEFETYEHLDLPLAKYNFFTSRFYSAVDIKLTSKRTPDVLILTDKHPYTRVDPQTESIQIQGRFRNGLKSLTHIAYYNEDIEVLSSTDIQVMLDAMKEVYDAVNKTRQTFAFSFSHIPNNEIRKQLEKLEYAKYLDENKNLNFFAVDNLHYDNKINSYYKSLDALKQAYEETDYFNVNYKRIDNATTLDILKLKELSLKEQRRNIVSQLEKIESDLTNGIITDKEKDSLLKLLRRVDDFIVEVYYLLGKSIIEKKKYRESNLTEELDKYKKENIVLVQRLHKKYMITFNPERGYILTKRLSIKR